MPPLVEPPQPGVTSTGGTATASSSSTTTPTTASITPPTTAKQAVEDDRENEGESLSTFSIYQPTALPHHVIHAFNNKNNCSNNNNNNEVIDLVQEEEDEKKDNLQLQIPSHTSLSCESNLLSSVPAPSVVQMDSTSCLLPLIQNTTTPFLSPLQMEGVLLAIQRHQRIYTISGERAGFFLGDGAGVGKGRQIAAILRNSLCRSNTTKRHLWLSVSRELIQDARRDLTAVGVHCDVQDGTTLLSNNRNVLKKQDKGVMFFTYPFLVSSNRLEQIITWCAGTHLYQKSASNNHKIRQLEQSFDGCIIFDEAHKAKNIANNTKTAQLVVQLQRRLPKARVVYCSATGVSDVAHLAYAERLGLWDNTTTPKTTASTHNFANFAGFQASLSSRGLGSLELLALELKQQGSFLARTLSWDGAEFDTSNVDLAKPQQRVYDKSVQWWNQCKTTLEAALKLLDDHSEQKPGMLWRIFWSAHQRFFKELAICGKVEFLAKDAMKMVHELGYCVVIGLQSTGESGMQSLLENSVGTSFQDEHFPTLISTLKATLIAFVKNHFPVKPAPPEPPKLPSEQPPSPTASIEERQYYAKVQSEIARIAALPPPEPLDDLVQMQQGLLDAIESLDLPPNPLDDLIDRLGGEEHVAEMTGRSGRMVRASSNRDASKKKDYFVFSKRVTISNSTAAVSQDDSDRLNLVERRAFQDGKKSFAIISDAASTGISLHAAQGSGGSHKRRVHYTIELPWSADKAVQQLGRSHRSGQESAPIYKLVVTTLGGESRFAAAVSKRMASLGALTKGDRRAATGGSMLADFDLDSKYGKRALKRFYEALDNNEQFRADPKYVTQASTFPSRNTKDLLNQFLNQLVEENDPLVATLPQDETVRFCVLLTVATVELELVGLDSDNRKKADVRVFLNRLAGLPVTKQSFTFSLFMSTLEDVIAIAKAKGEWEGTAEDISAEEINISEELDLALDPASGALTKLTTLALDRGISFETVCQMAAEDVPKASPAVDQAKPEEEPSEEEVSDDILDEDEEEDDEWLTVKANKEDSIAPQGFYVSRNKVAGRHFVLYAKHKFDRASFETSAAATDFDPQGWMVITRPNTGSGNEMSTQELKRKYRLLFSSEQLGGCLLDTRNEEDNPDAVSSNPMEVIEQQSKKVAGLWKEAYGMSNHYKHHNGLAPRRAKVALVTGPVLHVLPALENAVRLHSEKDRALKIMRAQVDGRRIVGVRFPTDDDAMQKLKSQITNLLNARNTGTAFIDEDLSPVCAKSQNWATTERKTMKSFFAVKKKSNAPTNTTQGNSKTPSSAMSTKRSAPTLAKSTNKKTKSIASFFAPVKKS